MLLLRHISLLRQRASLDMPMPLLRRQPLPLRYMRAMLMPCFSCRASSAIAAKMLMLLPARRFLLLKAAVAADAALRSAMPALPC